MADRTSFPTISGYYAERDKERADEFVRIQEIKDIINSNALGEGRDVTPDEQKVLDEVNRERERLIDEAERDERERNSGLTGEDLDELDRLEGTPEDMLTGEELDHRDRLRDHVNNAPQDPVPDPDEEYRHGGPPDVAGGNEGGGAMAGSGGGMPGGGGDTGGGDTDGGDTGGGATEGGAMAGGGDMPGGGGTAATRTPDMPAGPLEGGDSLQPGRIRYLPRGRIRGLSIGLLIRKRFGGAIDPGDSGPQTTVNRGGSSRSGGVIVDPVPDSGVRTGIRPPEDINGPRRDPTITDPAEDSDDPRPR